MAKQAAKRNPPAAGKSAKPPRAKGKPVLLSGENPQIAKGDGEAPVAAYLAAIPGWKQATARRLDALIVRTVPGVQKAVRWNTPFYGLPNQGWFIAYHCITKYIKVTFFQGARLQPIPPVASKMKHVRYLHLHEHDPFDEAQLSNWIRQAARLPGDTCF